MKAGESLLIILIALGLAGFLIYVAVRFAIRRFNIVKWTGITAVKFDYPLKKLIVFPLMDAEAGRRIVVTVFFLVLLYFLKLVPMPFLKSFFDLKNTPFADIPPTSVFLNGVAPFLSACILLQISSAFIPYIRRLHFGGRVERGKLAALTYSLTLIVAFAYSTMHVVSLAGADLLAVNTWYFYLGSVLAPTAATFLLLFIAALIERYGLGNGIAIVFGYDLLLETGWKILYLIRNHWLISFDTIVIIFFTALFFIVSYYVTRLCSRVELETGGYVVGIPMRLSMAGRVPLEIATTLALLPLTIFSFLTISDDFGFDILWRLFDVNGWVYWAIIIPLILLAAVFYFRIVLRTPYARPNINKLAVAAGLLLVFVSFEGQLVRFFTGVDFILNSIYILILTGIFYDLVAQLEFMKKRRESGIKEWEIIDIAPDEIEAELRLARLKQNNIPALIEPMRFTWGLPILTIVDRYRIYTPADKADAARALKSPVPPFEKGG